MTKRTLIVLAALVLAAAGIYYRSDNSKQAALLVNSITQQDAANQDSTAAIVEVRKYVGSHMGATSTFELKGAYARADAAARASAAATSANSQIYADAQIACSGKSDSITQAHCNQNYISSHLANVPAPTEVTAPKLADYQYHYAAPLWTPDFAGMLLLGAGLLISLGVLTSVLAGASVN